MRVEQDVSFPAKLYLDDAPIIDLLQSGKFCVLPPTIHPNTKKPYYYLPDSESLEHVDAEDLPIVGSEFFDQLVSALEVLGTVTTSKAEVRGVVTGVRTPLSEYPPLHEGPTAFLNWHALNDLDAWVPDLNLYRCEQRRDGSYKAVATWRQGGTGRSPDRRKLNLSIHPSGIKDMGADQGYSPIDLVMVAMGYDFDQADEWLEKRIFEPSEPFSFPEHRPDLINRQSMNSVRDGVRGALRGIV